MSVKTIEWAWRQNISPTQKLLLLAIATGACDDGMAWVSTTQLIEITGLSEQAVRQARADLKKRGFLKKNTANSLKQRTFLNMKDIAR